MISSRIGRTASLARGLRTSSVARLATPLKSTPAPSLADKEADSVPIPWLGTSTTGGDTKNLIGGEWTVGEGVESWIDVNDPSTQRVLTRVPETSFAAMTKIVDHAEQAFLEWRDTSVLRRQGVMLKSVRRIIFSGKRGAGRLNLLPTAR